MPKLEAKAVQKELESGQVWPVYWIHGPERMKSRELLRRIRRTVLGEKSGEPGFSSFLEEQLEGSETSAAAVVDSASALSLGGGTRLVLVREAHLIKEPEPMAALFGPKGLVAEIPAVVVFVSKDLDGRKKFSKLLIEGAAVIECAEIPEEEREPWIQYLAKRRGLVVPERLMAAFRALDPWSLDIVDQELEKMELLGKDAEALAADEDALGSFGNEDFFEAFFRRDKRRALELCARFADHPDESLPLLGLFAWNVRHLALAVSDAAEGTRSLKLSPFLVDRFKRWGRGWTLLEVKRLQETLQALDFSIKQTPRLPMGLWGDLVIEFT
jgi:DNA polymerase III delta subunit